MLTSPALSCAKPLRTFAGNAHFSRIVRRKTASHFCWKCSLLPHCPAQNRCALLLEMLTSPALSCAKPLRTFAGNAHFSRIVLRKTAAHFCWKCSLLTNCPSQNRCALLLEMLTSPALSCAKPLRTFAGNVHFSRIVLRKTAARFCWKCSLLPHCPTQNRFALLLEMLTSPALSCAKPLRTFAGNAHFSRIVRRKTAAHFCWKCSRQPRPSRASRRRYRPCGPPPHKEPG